MTRLLLLALLGFGLGASAQDLNVYLAASTDAPGPGDAIDYTLVVSNTGSTTLENVRVEVRLPEQVATFRTFDVVGSGLDCASQGICSPGETVAWAVGTLAPGVNRRLTYPTRIRDTPPSGDATTRIVASADNVSDIIQTHVVAVDPSPLLRLSLVPDPGPAVPGEPFTYTLTYGNVGASNPTGVALTMPVPEGTSFQSATEDGTESGGVVTWSLGTVGVGAGGRVEVTVVPEAGLETGATLEAEASLDSGVATELIVSSEAVTEVGPREALRFDYALSQNAVGPSGGVVYTLTATNISATSDLTGVAVEVRLPEQIATFRTFDVVGSGLDCASQGICSPGETVAWAVGTLAPGQSRTIVMPTSIASGAQQGEVLRTFYDSSADGLNEQTGGVDLVVDPSPVTGLRLIPGPGPVTPGEPFTYTLLFGNVGFQPTDLVLRMTLPEGAAFVSATGGGTEAEGVVTWQAPAVATEAVGRVQATVEVDEGLPVGALLHATAELDTGSMTEYTVHASTATPIQSEIPLGISYTANRSVGQPGDLIDFTVAAENTGSADLTDVRAEIRLPEQIATFRTFDVVGSGLDCASQGICSPGETVAWAVGTLAPGQSRTIVMPTSIAGDADEGQFLLSPVVATATGSNEVVLYNDVLLGTEFAFPTPGEAGPESAALHAVPAPNPTAGPARFLVSHPAPGHVRLAVYDVLGREVAVLLDGERPAGDHAVRWEADVPAGVYLWRLAAGDAVRTGSVTVVR